MSSYNASFKDKTTGEIVSVLCWDDYFGRHRYGYKMPNDKVLTETELGEHYERV